MSTKVFTRGLSLLLLIALVAPTAFFAAPPKASAQASALSCLGTLLFGAGAEVVSEVVAVPVADALTHAETTLTAGATTGDCIQTAIIMPLARMLARMILQQITASVISWINDTPGPGGTKQPSFVVNLAVNLQRVGDSAALALIGQTTAAFNSPFGPAIASSLQRAYLQQTSMAGFFAANQCTLAQVSPNINSFLAGNWSQGGVGAWLALTTQSQNNPYTLYQAAQSQLASNVANAQTNRRQDLIQSGGFMSWCGSGPSSSGASGRPSAPCMDNGVPGNVQTPGSVILGYANKTLGSGIDQLVSAQDLDSALGAIVSALIGQVLGGSGGLFGASQSSDNGRAVTTQLQNYASDNASAAASANSIAQTKLSQITAYRTAWNTVAASANAASNNVTALASSCSAQASAAQSALTNEIAPVLARAQTASTAFSATQTLAAKVQAEATQATSLSAANAGSAGALAADVQALAAAPPSTSDVVNAQQNAQAFGGARANPVDSLTVYGSSLVDQMNLISGNAQTLQTSTVCVAAPVIIDPNATQPGSTGI